MPVDGNVSGYQRHLGVGGSSWPMMGRFICNLGGQFSTLSQAALIAYRCDREGDRYENCREVKNQPVDSWATEHGVATYHLDGGEYWIVIHPAQ